MEIINENSNERNENLVENIVLCTEPTINKSEAELELNREEIQKNKKF